MSVEESYPYWSVAPPSAEYREAVGRWVVRIVWFRHTGPAAWEKGEVVAVRSNYREAYQAAAEKLDAEARRER